MERYDYLAHVKADIAAWIDDETTAGRLNIDGFESVDDLAEELNDRLWACDPVTGNASGSYTFNAYEAEENLCHNLDLLGEALKEFGDDASYLFKNGAEACDVAIRCYLLGQAIAEVLEENGAADYYANK